MLCFCTLCSYATCEWPEFYVNKDMFCSVNFKDFCRVAQSVTCLATDACPGGREFDPGPVPYFRGD